MILDQFGRPVRPVPEFPVPGSDMAETMTPAGLLRKLAETTDAVDMGAERACRDGADALERLAQTCGNCQHANTDDMVDGWCRCAATRPSLLQFVGPDNREAWAERLAHDRRYPHLGREIPIDERCKGWAKREDA